MAQLKLIFPVAAGLLCLCGLVLLLVGYTVPLVEARIAGLFILILALVMAAMKCVVYYSSPEQRAASLPYSGFNSTWVTRSLRCVKVLSVSGLPE